MSENGDARPSLGLLVGKLEGIQGVMTAQFNAIQQQLDRRFSDITRSLARLEQLPSDVAAVETRLDDTIKRMDAIEAQVTRQNEWKRGPLFVVSVGVVIAVVNLLPLIIK